MMNQFKGHSVSQDNKINFKIYIISSQTLYNKVESVPLKEYQVELNIAD